jgi:hypothetical protein
MSPEEIKAMKERIFSSKKNPDIPEKKEETSDKKQEQIIINNLQNK